MRSSVLSFLKRRLPIERIYLNYLKSSYNSKSRLPWQHVCTGRKWDEFAHQSKEKKKKVLMATCAGGLVAALDMESLLAVALTLRGVDVHALICDRFLPACIMCELNTSISLKRFAFKGPTEHFCRICSQSGIEAYQSAGIKIHHFSEFVSTQDILAVDEITESTPCETMKDFTFDNLAVGEHAVAGALRFYARSSLEGEPFSELVMKRYFRASLLTAIAVQKIQNEQQFDAAVFHHGIYVPQGIIGEVLRKESVDVVNWNVGYREGTFIFSHNDTYHHTMMSEPASSWESLPWNHHLESAVMNYIRNRSKGTRDWHVFLNEPAGDISALRIDPSKPSIGLLTNVCWDAQLHYPANVFNDMLEWIFETIEYFKTRSDLQLIIRVHPAEVTAELPSRQLVVEEINKVYSHLPENIFIVAPQSKLNTYSLMESCDAVIIYGTKTGVELTSFGIPVVVAGEAWIRDKGITIDPKSRKEYMDVLGSLPFGEKMDERQKRRARKYAYHFFFRRMIPVEVISPVESAYSFTIRLDDLDDLLPGRNTGLDVLCDGILYGRDFIYKHELTF